MKHLAVTRLGQYLAADKSSLKVSTQAQLFLVLQACTAIIKHLMQSDRP